MFPTEVFGPSREEEPQGVGAPVLAFGPWDRFDGDAAGLAIDAAHAIAQPHGNVPEGDEVERAPARHVVVGGSLATAARTYGLGILARDDPDFDDGTEVFKDQADLLVNKGLDRMHNAEQGFERDGG